MATTLYELLGDDDRRFIPYFGGAQSACADYIVTGTPPY